MPDVEVKLNIEAQHKEALSAIQELGKALQAVQDKAKAVTDSAKSVTANTAGNKQQGSTEDVAALTKANTELARALVLVNKAAEQAKVSIAALSALQPQSPEAAQMLQQAASGYERLANMAKAAADAAERFNTVGKAGLTTEEMVKQTEAAGKMVESLKKRAEELQKNISAQQEQLAALKAITAEQQKASQTRNKEQKEIERSAALREREKKAEEELEYRMKLSTLTRQQLAAEVSNLNKKLNDAALQKDAVAWSQYNEQLRIARSELEKSSTRMTATRILYAQQAQAASRFSGNLQQITEGLGNMSKAAEEGELNLTGMLGSVVDLVDSIKAGLGPIGWAMIALQALQTAWNSYAKTKKQIAETEKETAEILKTEKALYEELAKAQKEFEAQQALQKHLTTVRGEYDTIKRRLAESLTLIEASTKAEIVRLSILQDADEMQRTQKRYELGRAFKRGDISEEEYRKQLIQLDKEEKVAKANKSAAEAETKLEAATKEAEEKEAVAKSTFEAWDKAATKAKEFNIREEQITSRENTIQQQQDKADAYLLKYQEAAIDQGLTKEEAQSYLDSFSDPQKKAEVFSALQRKYRGTIDFLSLAQWAEKYTTASTSAENIQSELNKLLGGRASSEYLNAKNTAERELDIRTKEKDEANAAAREAWKVVYSLTQPGNIEHNRRKSISQAEIEAEEKTKDVDTDIEVARLTAERRQKLETARNTVSFMSNKELGEARSEAKRGMSSTNEKESDFYKFLYSIYTEESTRRHYLDDGKLDKGEQQEVYRNWQNAMKRGDTEKASFYKNIMETARLMAEKSKQDEKLLRGINRKLEKMNGELGR